MSVSCMEYCVILYVKDNLINILFPVVAIVPLHKRPRHMGLEIHTLLNCLILVHPLRRGSIPQPRNYSNNSSEFSWIVDKGWCSIVWGERWSFVDVGGFVDSTHNLRFIKKKPT
jgi:hypothetical protein